jgi:hypothetical protein
MWDDELYSVDDTLDTSSTATGYTDLTYPRPPLRYRQIEPQEKQEWKGCNPFWSLLMDDPFEVKKVSDLNPKVQRPRHRAIKHAGSSDDDEDSNSTGVIYSEYSPTKRRQQPNPPMKRWANIGISRYPIYGSSSSSASSGVGSEGEGEATQSSKSSNDKNSLLSFKTHTSIVRNDDNSTFQYDGARDGDTVRSEGTQLGNRSRTERRRKEKQSSLEDSNQYQHLASLRRGIWIEDRELPPRPPMHQSDDASKTTKSRVLPPKNPLGAAMKGILKQKEGLPTKEPDDFEAGTYDRRDGPNQAQNLHGQDKVKVLRKVTKPKLAKSPETAPTDPDGVNSQGHLMCSKNEDTSCTFQSKEVMVEEDYSKANGHENSAHSCDKELEILGPVPDYLTRNLIHSSGRRVFDAGTISSMEDASVSLPGHQNGGYGDTVNDSRTASPEGHSVIFKSSSATCRETKIPRTSADDSDYSFNDDVDNGGLQNAQVEELKDRRDDFSVKRNAFISQSYSESLMKPREQRKSSHPTIALWRTMAAPTNDEVREKETQSAKRQGRSASIKKADTTPLLANPIRSVSSTRSAKDFERREMTNKKQVDLRTATSLVDSNVVPARSTACNNMSDNSIGGTVASLDRRKRTINIPKFRVRDTRSVC